MAKSPKQKLKLIYLRQIFLEKTDETHSLTMKEIISELQQYDITAERKSIYDDIETLKYAGMDIRGEKRGGAYYYYVATRGFEKAELRLLVSAVESAKFISQSKSNELIKKITSLTSCYEAAHLKRHVYVSNRVKTMNEYMYYNVDKLNTAIVMNRKVSYQYSEYTINKQRVLRHNGAKYKISPIALNWNDSNYYVIGYDEKTKIIKNYRVDKIINLEILDDARARMDENENFDVAQYVKKLFSMFGGEEQAIKLQFENRLIGVVLDRFGENIMIIPKGPNHFVIHVTLVVSVQFLAWIVAHGTGVKIVKPDHVVEYLKRELKSIQKIYE